jgi:hypothetical protein
LFATGARVVDGRLGAQGTPLLEVLLDARGLVVDVQRRGDALGDDAGAKAPRRPPGDAPIEDQADLLGAAEVEVLADDLLKQMPSRKGTVEDLRAGEFRLQDGDVVVVAGGTIGIRERLQNPQRHRPADAPERGVRPANQVSETGPTPRVLEVASQCHFVCRYA